MLLKDIYVDQIVGFTNKNGVVNLCKIVALDDDPNYVVIHMLGQSKQMFKKAINNLLGLM